MLDVALFDGSCAICGSSASESDRIQSAIEALNGLQPFIDLLASVEPPSIKMEAESEVSIRCQFGQALFWHSAIKRALAILEGRDQG